MTTLRRIIFPPVCIWCEQEGSYFCADCTKEIYTYPEVCFYCRNKRSQFRICHACRSNTVMSNIIIWFWYTGTIQKAIKAIKYYNYTTLVEPLVEKLYYTIPQWVMQWVIDSSDTLLTSIPMHRWKQYMIRWYNQTEKIAKSLAKKLAVPYKNLCVKSLWTSSQTRFSRQQRKENVTWSFRLSKKVSKTSMETIRTIIIVDDIVTTWATLSALARCINQDFPHIRIIWLVVARN